MIVFERRASVILFNLLRARGDAKPFLIPANACPVVPETFVAAGQPFSIVDIAEPWLEVDARVSVERARTRGLAGILFVRPYGSERDPSPLFSALRAVDSDLLIIDDKCLCQPDPDGESLSPIADATLFSTGQGKFADLRGGGFAHLRDGVAYRRAPDAPDWLDRRPPDSTWAAYRARITEATRAATRRKTALNAIYSAEIPARVQLPAALQNWRFNIRVPNSERLVSDLFAHGLFASRHYPPLGESPVARKLHAEIVNLFNDRSFTRGQARQAAALVTHHLPSTIES